MAVHVFLIDTAGRILLMRAGSGFADGQLGLPAGHVNLGETYPRWVEVVKALGYVEAGWWTTYGDLATLTGLFAQSVGKSWGLRRYNAPPDPAFQRHHRP